MNIFYDDAFIYDPSSNHYSDHHYFQYSYGHEYFLYYSYFMNLCQPTSRLIINDFNLTSICQIFSHAPDLAGLSVIVFSFRVWTSEIDSANYLIGPVPHDYSGCFNYIGFAGWTSSSFLILVQIYLLLDFISYFLGFFQMEVGLLLVLAHEHREMEEDSMLKLNYSTFWVEVKISWFLTLETSSLTPYELVLLLHWLQIWQATLVLDCMFAFGYFH